MYWTATAFAEQPGFAIAVNFSFVTGSDAPIGVTDANVAGGLYHVWAVRGGHPGLDSYLSHSTWDFLFIISQSGEIEIELRTVQFNLWLNLLFPLPSRDCRYMLGKRKG